MAVHFSEKQFKELIGEAGVSKNKYRNVRTVLDGHTFDSEREMERYAELRLMERAGEISELQLQPVFELIPAVKENGKVVQRAITYKGDFSYIRNGSVVVEDAKGVKTDVYKLKKKMMRALLGIVVQEV